MSAIFTGFHRGRTTVLVADDHVLIRNGIKLLVRDILGDAEFLEADDGDSLSNALRFNPRIRVALIELNMPGMRGGQRLAELARQYQKIALIVVSAGNPLDVMRQVMNIPTVSAFVPKNADVVQFRLAIQAAMHGKRLGMMPSSCSPSECAALTPRQEEICGLLRQGMSNKVIAGTLGISEGTVKNHITDIFKILNATNRTQAAQLSLDTRRTSP